MALTRFLNRLGFEGDRADVIQFWIAVVLQLVILFFFVSALWDGRWLLASPELEGRIDAAYGRREE